MKLSFYPRFTMTQTVSHFSFDLRCETVNSWHVLLNELKNLFIPDFEFIWLFCLSTTRGHLKPVCWSIIFPWRLFHAVSQRPLGPGAEASVNKQSFNSLWIPCTSPVKMSMPKNNGPMIFSNLHFCHLFGTTTEIKLQQPTVKLIGYGRQSLGHFLSRYLLLY